MVDFQGLNALIIDDEDTSVDVLQYLLGALGIQVEVIKESHGISESLQTITRPHVVFLDLEMPAVNGYQVLSLLREAPRFEGVPIVAYTTHISHMNEARVAGFDGFLGKPIDRKSFPEHLTKILNGEEVWVIR